MSWLTDPYQLAQPPSVEEVADEDEEAFPSLEDTFHESFRHYPDSVGYQRGIHVDVCRFDETGSHIQMASNCPHFEAEDEQGMRIQQGWTIQQQRR